MITRRTVIVLSASQLVCWGISYYLIAAFAPFIAADLGWSAAAIHGGFSAALAVMGLTSPAVGRLIDRHGGARVMTAGSLATALGCAILAVARGPVVYITAWLCLGLAMRLTLYDAAFAALARIGGADARRPIALITLAGGLASTVFWPVGHQLAVALGWRAALLVYAGLALGTALLHLTIPTSRHRAPDPPPGPVAAPDDTPRKKAALYAVIVAMAAFLNTGMSAHMIGILQGLGVAASIAVWLATLRGIGQSGGRLLEVVFGRRLHPLALGVLASGLLPLAFAAGLLSGHTLLAGAAFALVYGAGNGLLTIVRGTAPLFLFGTRDYGAVVGRLLAPSFLLSAVSPIVYALVIESAGEGAALQLSLAAAAIIFMAALWLRALGARNHA